MKKIEMNVSMQRKLSKVLEYKGWKNFLKVLSKAKETCKNFGFKTMNNLLGLASCQKGSVNNE